ncbi:hypothetical protein BVC80_1543g84 [Macleaya cordata]|uniref:Uncharacterized protein n=1 Tax=Macleaya cordata TaxID=56857 RepID=A0A200R1U7_MACCD|nr:hypothetical protein BVC80_1543g84 [Macleaya cordata]
MKREQHSECGSCNSKEHWLLHNIPQRGIYRRLCTSCVLKLHPGLFCPNCFEVYEGSNPPNNGITCLKCLSVSHLACVSKEIGSRYVCTTCLNPSHVFFDSNKKSKNGNGETVPNENHLAINLNMAKVLLAASKIASILMNKAASAARMEAEKRVREAAFTRKKAKEALEKVNGFAYEEKEKNGKETARMEIVPSSVVEEEQKKKSRGNSAVAAAVAAQKRFQNQVMALNDGKDKDKSGEAPVVLDNAVLREKEMSVGLSAQNLAQKPPANGVMGHPQLQNPVIVNGKEKSTNFSHSQNGVVQGEKEKNGLVSVAHGVEENQGKSKEFGDAGMVPQLTHSNKGAFVSKTNEGVLLPTGSSKTAS